MSRTPTSRTLRNGDPDSPKYESDGEVKPRGDAHRGYAGGELERLPHLDPHVRIPDGLGEEYEAGQSIRQIATATDLSITRVRTFLEESGAELRGRGRIPAERDSGD